MIAEVIFGVGVVCLVVWYGDKWITATGNHLAGVIGPMIAQPTREE